MAFVQSDGQVVSTVAAPGAAHRPTSAWLSPSLRLDYAAVYRSQPAVRTCVSFLARNIAQLGLPLYRRVSDTERVRVSDHPVAALLRRPNHATTRYRMLDVLVNDLGIYDETYWVKVREGDRRALFRLPPWRVTPIGGFVGPDGFRVEGARGVKEFPAEQVLYMRGYNPTDERVGLSPIETLRGLLAEAYSAQTYREQLWWRGGRHAGFIRRPVEAPDWSDQARERFKTDYRDLYTGDGAQAGGVPLLEDGMEYVPVGMTAQEAQYVESRKLTREEAAAAYHIPLPMVGILDNATFSNITEQHKQLYQDTLGPWLQNLQQELWLQLVTDMDPAGADELYLEFNLAEKLRGSFTEEASRLQTSVGAPWLTRNEARARQNLPPVDGGDELVVPLNVLVGGQASPTDSAPPASLGRSRVLVKAADPAGPSIAESVLVAFFARQRDEVLSELGAKARSKDAVGDAFDTERWDGELAADLFAVSAGVAERAATGTLQALPGGDWPEFDPAAVSGWLAAQAAGVATAVNATTLEQLRDADDRDALVHVFEVAMTARAAQIAVSQTTAVAGFASEDVVKRSGRPAVKTWTVMSSNPRPTHAALNGETVPVGQPFSNGARWPGDSSLPPGERAGCTCHLTIGADE